MVRVLRNSSRSFFFYFFGFWCSIVGFVLFNEFITLPFYTRFRFDYVVTVSDKFIILFIALFDVGLCAFGMYFGDGLVELVGGVTV